MVWRFVYKTSQLRDTLIIFSKCEQCPGGILCGIIYPMDVSTENIIEFMLLHTLIDKKRHGI